MIAADRVERFLDAVRGLLGDQEHAIVAPVVRELGAEAVENASAQRRQQPLADAIFLGARHVLVAVDDLQLIEPPAQHREHRAHAAAHHQRAPGEGRVAGLVLAVEQRHQKSLRKAPINR